jgi:hypothetical protein
MRLSSKKSHHGAHWPRRRVDQGLVGRAAGGFLSAYRNEECKWQSVAEAGYRRRFGARIGKLSARYVTDSFVTPSLVVMLLVPSARFEVDTP